MNQHPTVLILGARGRFGRAAASAFAHAGWSVVGQLRAGGEPPELVGVRWIAADPGDTQALAHAAHGATVVVQALSPVYTNRAWRTGVPHLTQAAIDATRALGATLMLPASVYNFGEGMPALLHEHTPQQPTTEKGRMRLASERQILAATRDGGMKAVVIRGGDFFGSGTGSWFDQVMVKEIDQGVFTYPGALDVRTTWAYLPDMARSFVEVAGRIAQLPAFETLHFAGHAVTGQQWADVLRDIAWEQGWLQGGWLRQGGTLRVKSVAWNQMRLIGVALPVVASLCEMRYLWRTPYTLVNKRMHRLTGAEPQTPFAQAVRAALADLGLLSPVHTQGLPAVHEVHAAHTVHAS